MCDRAQGPTNRNLKATNLKMKTNRFLPFRVFVRSTLLSLLINSFESSDESSSAKKVKS